MYHMAGRRLKLCHFFGYWQFCSLIAYYVIIIIKQQTKHSLLLTCTEWKLPDVNVTRVDNGMLLVIPALPD